MENYVNVCVTCLSNDRRLDLIHNIAFILQDIGFNELEATTGSICWECRSIIMKFHRFKMRAVQAQAALSHHVQTKNMKSLTSLVTKTLHNDHHYYYIYDPFADCETLPKTEHDNVKEEYQENIDDVNDNLSDSDIQSEIKDKVEHVYIETINTTKLRKKSKIDQKEFEKKFVKVDFSEEEMIKNREDKRNHYNFKKIPFKCDSCVLGFTRKETFNVHMEKKHGEGIGGFSCDVCQCRFSTESVAVSHRKRHYMSYRCRLCRYNTTELWSAVNHCKVKHEKDQVDSIHCKQCETVVKTPEELEEHKQAKHTVYCNECGVRFKGNHTLRRHKARIHAAGGSFPCAWCSRSFPSGPARDAHVSRHSASLARQLAYCAACDVHYKNIYVYRSHLRNSANHADRTYSCPECDKKFASKVYRTKHYNFYHLHKSQYKCETCNKLFISEWRLKNHRQKHHGLSRPRDHSCNICGKKFFTISMLRNHQLTHSEQRSYMCEDCGDTFKQRPALYTHAKLVHGDRRNK